MSKSLAELLHFSALSGVVRETSGGVPNVLPPAFFSLTRQVSGRQHTFDILSSTRQTAKSVQPGSPSVRRVLQKIGQQSVTIPRFAEHIMIEGDPLVALRSFGNEAKQEKGREYVDYQVAEFGRRFDNTRVAMVYSLLKHGKIYFKLDGNGGYDLLPTSSGADLTIDMQIPANNIGSLNGLLTDWSVASTDIIGQIQAICEQSLKDTGLEAVHFFYGPNVRKYILANNGAKELLKTDSGMANSIKMGAIPNGFGDARAQWHPLQRGFFANSAGTNNDWFTGDELTVTPEPNRDWYEMIEGSELMPTGALGANATADEVLNANTEIFGRGSYAKQTDDPVAIKVVAFDNVLPTIKVPAAVYLGDVTN